MLLYASVTQRELAVRPSAHRVHTQHKSQSASANIRQIFPQSTRASPKTTTTTTTTTLTPTSMLLETRQMVQHLQVELRLCLV
jgi:hypothetical protein